MTKETVTPIFHGNLRFATGFLYYNDKSYMLGTGENHEKRLKGESLVFFFFALHICLEKRAGSKGSRKCNKGFSRIFYIPAGAVLKGGSLQKLQEIYDGMSCIAYTEDGEELYLDAIWDYSGIDIQTVGAYKITGTVRLPEGYTSNVGLPEWTAWISVQNPGQPEIQVYSRMISAGIYYFPWITEQNPDKMAIWLQKEGEDWVNVSEEGYGFCGYRWDVSFLPEYDS